MLIAFFQDYIQKKKEKEGNENIENEDNEMIKLEEPHDIPDDYMAMNEDFDNLAINESDENEINSPERTARILSYRVIRTKSMIEKEAPDVDKFKAFPVYNLEQNLNQEHFYKEQNNLSPLKRQALKKKSKIRIALDSKFLSLAYRMKKHYFLHKDS